MKRKPTTETRRQVLARDGCKCAICGRSIDTEWSGFSIHHRRMRSHGSGYESPPQAEKPPGDVGFTLLTLCGSGTTGCHGWVHAHPNRAYQLGYLVSMSDDPIGQPVYYRTGGWQQLHADGTRHPCPPPENLPTHIDIKKGDQ